MCRDGAKGQSGSQKQNIIMLNAFGQDRHFWAIWSDADINKWWAEQAEAAFCWEKKR